MPETATFIAFILAVLALQTLPGPDMMLVISKGAGQSRRHAFFCVLGFAAAGFVQIPALAFGIASLIKSSPISFLILQYLGAAYLIYLGGKYILDSNKSLTTESNRKAPSCSSTFKIGFLSNLLNPKFLVFMLAFLPQFVDPSKGNMTTQLIILGVIMKCSGFIVNGSIAYLSGFVGNWLSSHSQIQQWQQRFVGGVLITLGFRLLLDSKQ